MNSGYKRDIPATVINYLACFTCLYRPGVYKDIIDSFLKFKNI